MTNAVALLLEQMVEELSAAEAYAAAAGLPFDDSAIQEGTPVIRVTLFNRAAEAFYIVIDCTDYPKYPPTIEFTDEAGLRRGEKTFYPSCFHPTPCVCARYSRKAYSEKGGPHGDWRLVDWHLPTGNGIRIDTIAMIISDLHSKTAASTGRLG